MILGGGIVRHVASLTQEAQVAPRVTDAKVRFWRLVRKTRGCWLWSGVRQGRGYGFFNPDGTYEGRKRKGGLLAHRFAWFLESGNIPDNLCVCHHCDNKLCVRPSHLFLATPKMNSLDMVQKKRCRGGKNQPHFSKIDRHHNLPMAEISIGTRRRFGPQ